MGKRCQPRRLLEHLLGTACEVGERAICVSVIHTAASPSSYIALYPLTLARGLQVSHELAPNRVAKRPWRKIHGADPEITPELQAEGTSVSPGALPAAPRSRCASSRIRVWRERDEGGQLCELSAPWRQTAPAHTTRISSAFIAASKYRCATAFFKFPITPPHHGQQQHNKSDSSTQRDRTAWDPNPFARRLGTPKPLPRPANTNISSLSYHLSRFRVLLGLNKFQSANFDDR